MTNSKDGDDDFVNYEVVAAKSYKRELRRIYLRRIVFKEDVPYADEFLARVSKSVRKLSYLAGTSPNKYQYVGARKYYLCPIEKGKYSILYTINKRQKICRVWHIFSNKMNFR